MALDYYLTIHDERRRVDPAEVKARLMSTSPLEATAGSEILRGRGVSVSVFSEEDEQAEKAGFAHSGTCVAFRIAKFEEQEAGIDEMLRMVDRLTRDRDGEAVLSFELEDTLLRRTRGELVLADDPEFWTPARRAIFAGEEAPSSPRDDAAAPARPLLLEVGKGPSDGAHRLIVGLRSPTDRWPEVARRLALDIQDAERAAAWDAGARLELVGWSGTPTEGRFYLAGSALHWMAFSAQQMQVPLLTHLPLMLGQPVAALRLESRPLGTPSYEQITGRQRWPFRTQGPVCARRVTITAPALSEGQMLGLGEMVMPALRRQAWERGEVPGEARPTVEKSALALPEGLRAGALLEVVHVWAQVFWVDVEAVEWTS